MSRWRLIVGPNSTSCAARPSNAATHSTAYNLILDCWLIERRFLPARYNFVIAACHRRRFFKSDGSFVVPVKR